MLRPFLVVFFTVRKKFSGNILAAPAPPYERQYVVHTGVKLINNENKIILENETEENGDVLSTDIKRDLITYEMISKMVIINVHLI